MSTIDDAIRANESYSRGFDQGKLAMPPARKLAIVACMDARLTIEPMLGLKTGDAHIIRNAGGVADQFRLGLGLFVLLLGNDCRSNVRWHVSGRRSSTGESL